MKLTFPITEQPRLVMRKALHGARRKKMSKAMRTTGPGPNGHVHEYDDDLEDSFTTMVDGHRHPVVINADGVFVILEADGHPHTS